MKQILVEYENGLPAEEANVLIEELKEKFKDRLVELDKESV